MPYPQAYAMTSVQQASHSMGSQPFSLDLTRRGAALIGAQPRQAGNLNRPTNLSGEISRALTMARYTETLDKRSNRAEAVRAYQRAGALFQEVIPHAGHEVTILEQAALLGEVRSLLLG